MAVHKCSHCSYLSNRTANVRRHMDLKHNDIIDRVVYPQHQGYVECPPNFQQSANLPYPAQHPYNPQPVGHLYGERPVNVQSPAPYTYHNQRHIGGLKRHDDILSVASTYGSESGTEVDAESVDS